VSTPAIRTSGLTKFYGTAAGIVGLDLEVGRGEIYGFLGPNGAGKTTTIRLLLHLIRPNSGDAEVLGRNVATASKAIRREVGYLPGDLSLYGHLDGNALLRYLGSLRGGLDAAYVHGLAQRLGADLHRPIRNLSHGNRQKIGLLQAMAHRPALLILDEPTLGLDPLVQQEVYALLAETREDGRTVFFSSHVLPEVERVCDRVSLVRDGRLVAVEDVVALRRRAIRHVEITFVRPPAADLFRALDGVEDLVVEDRRLRCRVRGSLAALLATAVAGGAVDLISHEPSLEEVFLAFYGESRRDA
jgi:beta-exotoxin I transport system ATP-binding protein